MRKLALTLLGACTLAQVGFAHKAQAQFNFNPLDIIKPVDIITGVAGIDPTSGITVTGVSSGGPGCPQGTVNVTMSPDGSVFTVLYDQLSLQVGPGAPQGTTTCEVTINVTKPTMMGIQIDSADFRGFVGLDGGVSADQQVQVAGGMQSDLQKYVVDFGRQTWKGPVQSDYTLSTVKPVAMDFLSCAPPQKQTSIVIKTQLRMSQTGNPNGQGLLTVDSTDGQLVQRYHMKWIDCKKVIAGILKPKKPKPH